MESGTRLQRATMVNFFMLCSSSWAARQSCLLHPFTHASKDVMASPPL